MRRYFIIFLFLNILFGSLFAVDGWIKCEKEYIDYSQITINGNGIFVNIDDNLIQVKNIESEQNGFSFSEISKQSVVATVKWNWTCPRCGTINNPFRKYCKNCKYRW